MIFRPLLLVAAVLAALPAAAGQPPRFSPAPAGKVYFLFNASNHGLSEFKSSESLAVPTNGPTTDTMESTWKSSYGEVALTAGVGMGSLMFIRSSDLSLYLPLGFRSYTFGGSLWGGDARFAQATLHDSLREGSGGMGMGDAELNAMATFYADADTGWYVSGGLKMAMATGSSAGERFIRILHGGLEKPGTGEGVSQLVPGVFVVKTFGGYHAFVSMEYALPLGTETFSFTSPDEPRHAYLDENTMFEEEIKRGGVFRSTIGLRTPYRFWGVTPLLEIGIRQMAAATWTENGEDGTAYNPNAASRFPTHTPEFLKTAAWAVGGLPLDGNTEIEIGVAGAYQMVKRSEQLKIGVSYIAGSYGKAVGFKLAYTSMLVAKSKEEMPKKEGLQVEEVEVAPMLAAPAAPRGRARVAVAFPLYSAGTSQAQAAWVGAHLRRQAARRPEYTVISEADMAQFAQIPCGDAACGAQFGRSLGLDGMIVSRLDRVGDPATPNAGYALSVQMVNVSDGSVAASETVSAIRLDDVAPQIAGLMTRMAGGGK